MKISQILTFLFLTFITQTVNAQERFKDGYVVQQNGDTTFGFIQQILTNRNPGFISFKKVKQEKECRRFYPRDIHSFKVGKQKYISAHIWKEISSASPVSMSFEPAPKYLRDSAFLKVIIDGKKSLYRYQPLTSKQNFYVRDNDSFALLVFSEYLQYETQEGSTFYGERKVVKANNMFRSQLLVYLEDCEGFIHEVGLAEYTIESLKSLFNNYYACKSLLPIYVESRPKGNIFIEPVLGLDMAKLNVTINEYPYLDKADYPVDFSPTYGVRFGYRPAKTVGRVGFNADIIYSRFDSEAVYIRQPSRRETYIDTTGFATTYLRISVGPSWSIYKTNSSIEIGINGSMGYLLEYEDYRKLGSDYYGIINHTVTEILTPYQFEPGVSFDLAYVHKDFIAKYRVLRTRGFSIGGIKTQMLNHSLTLGYRL